MDPLLILTTSLFYMAQADGLQDAAEHDSILASIRSPEYLSSGTLRRLDALVQRAQQYALVTPVAEFLPETDALTDAQRLATLMRMAELSGVDGKLTRAEMALLHEFRAHWGIDEARFKPFLEVILLRCDLGVFTDPSHPSTASGHRVTLSVDDAAS